MFGSSPFDRRFRDVFREIEQEMNEMEQRMERMLEEGTEAREGQPYVYGWTMQVGPDGVPRVREFGNVGRTQGELEEGWREPFVTSVTDDDAGEVRFTAELPGIQKDDVQVKVHGDRVLIQAEGQDRRYRTSVQADRELDPESANARYNNGILELTVGIREEPEDDGHTVDVQ